MRFRHVLMTSLVLLSAPACTNPTSPETTVPLPVTRLRTQGVNLGLGLERPATFVVRDPDTWQSTWNQMHQRTLGGPPPLPAIDFATEMIAVAALGAQPNSGYAITLTGATDAHGFVTVEALSTSPGPNCLTLQVITYPMDVARLPRRDGTVGFRLTPDVTSCR